MNSDVRQRAREYKCGMKNVKNSTLRDHAKIV